LRNTVGCHTEKIFIAGRAGKEAGADATAEVKAAVAGNTNDADMQARDRLRLQGWVAA
jgi:hypothetical protein